MGAGIKIAGEYGKGGIRGPSRYFQLQYRDRCCRQGWAVRRESVGGTERTLEMLAFECRTSSRTQTAICRLRIRTSDDARVKSDIGVVLGLLHMGRPGRIDATD